MVSVSSVERKLLISESNEVYFSCRTKAISTKLFLQSKRANSKKILPNVGTHGSCVRSICLQNKGVYNKKFFRNSSKTIGSVFSVNSVGNKSYIELTLYYAFEIKMAERISAIDARHLINIETILDKPLICGFILSNDNETRQITPNIIGVNATMFLG